MKRPISFAPILCAALSVLLSACTTDPLLHADEMSHAAGLQREQVKGGQFTLTAYARITDPAQPLTVYIEGDGLAWRSRYEPSSDPTPRRAIGLSLAAADRSPNVVYLARPCQFTPMNDNPGCSVGYWTGKRFAPEVIVSMDAAVTSYMARLPGQRVNLVGYSGGGAVAVLVAARRKDVASLRTVAGNLDHDAVNRLHKVSLMPDSLNAISVADRVAAIPQVHFSGADDKIVPPVIAQDFTRRIGACAQAKIVPGLSHEGNWGESWPTLLAVQPRCKNGMN